MSPAAYIIRGDAARLPLADQSVDLVFGSPPYCDARTYGIGAQRTAAIWVDWMLAVSAEALRVSRGAVMWVAAGVTRDRTYWPAVEGLLWEWYKRGGSAYRPAYFHRVGVPGSGGDQWYRADVEYVLCLKRHGRLPYADPKANGHPPKWAPGGELAYRLTDGTRRNQWGAGARSAATRRADGTRQRPGRPSHRTHSKRDPAGHMQTQNYAAPTIANPGNLVRCKVGGGADGTPTRARERGPIPGNPRRLVHTLALPARGNRARPVWRLWNHRRGRPRQRSKRNNARPARLTMRRRPPPTGRRRPDSGRLRMSDDAAILRDILGTPQAEALLAPRKLTRRPIRATRDAMRETRARDFLRGELPPPGHSLHFVWAGQWDTAHVLYAIVRALSPATLPRVRVATLGTNDRHGQRLIDLLDAGTIGHLDVLLSHYFRSMHDGEPIYQWLERELTARGSRCANTRNHAKVAVFDVADGRRYVLETSSNLRTCRGIEQGVLSHDANLAAFHAAWIDAVFDQVHHSPPPDRQAKPPKFGTQHRRAGLGVLAYTNNPGERRRVIAWKMAAFEAAETTDRLAAAVVELVRTWSPTLPPAAVVTYPPQGASFPGTYYAARLAARVAELLAVPVAATLTRTDRKTRHHPTAALAQTAFAATVTPGATYIVFDDLITSGATMRLSLAALREAGAAAFGFAYSGS